MSYFARCSWRGVTFGREESLCLMFSLADRSTFLFAVFAAQSWVFHVMSCSYLYGYGIEHRFVLGAERASETKSRDAVTLSQPRACPYTLRYLGSSCRILCLAKGEGKCRWSSLWYVPAEYLLTEPAVLHSSTNRIFVRPRRLQFSLRDKAL